MMSADADIAACLKGDNVEGIASGDPQKTDPKKNRSVRFPSENHLVTEYFEPANPWHDVHTTSRAQLAQEYLLSCRGHCTPPIDSVLQQIRELPEESIGGGSRAARLTLADCSLGGAAPADALEALLRKVQFRRIELDHAEVDDEGAEALFDMIEYYESATVICITGPRLFGIRGWQAASRMIKKSAELSELEVAESGLEPSHAPVLARALRPHTCRLRALCLQRANLSGEALMCLVIALKSNASIRELRLPDNCLTAHDAQQLGSLLRFNNNIQLLDLSNNQITDIGVGHLADSIVDQAAQTPPSAATSPISPHLYPLSGGEARGLAFLVLWNNQLTRNCAHHLTKALRSSHSLCVLNVGRNALGAEAIRGLASGAALGGALLSLGLQCARLGPDAAHPLSLLLRADSKLQRLDLRDNRLGAPALQTLLTALRDNRTLTQIDLDEPTESSTLSEDGEAASVSRLTRDIRAACRRNEPPAAPPAQHRRISLTCHETGLKGCRTARASGVATGSRLRSPLPSPAPSPAGSPVPHHHVQVSRFSVTKVTPERELSAESSSSTSSPTRLCTTPPSRFKVVQVPEPPQIQVHPAKRISSRFSVTRNYDSCYNPSPSGSPTPSPTPSVSPTPPTNSPTPANFPTPSASPCLSDNSDKDIKCHQNTDAKSATIEKCDTISATVDSAVESVASVSKNDSTTTVYGSKSNTDFSYDSLGNVVSKSDSTPSIYSLHSNRSVLRYDSPSITTLSGALFSRSVPQMSTTTICPSNESFISTDSIEISKDPLKSSQIPLTKSFADVPIIKSSPEIPIIKSSTEIQLPRSGTTCGDSLGPVAVPNSRFSISPSPVSFISPVEDIYRPREEMNYTKTATVIGSQTNIRREKFDLPSVIVESSSKITNIPLLIDTKNVIQGVTIDVDQDEINVVQDIKNDSNEQNISTIADSDRSQDTENVCIKVKEPSVVCDKPADLPSLVDPQPISIEIPTGFEVENKHKQDNTETKQIRKTEMKSISNQRHETEHCIKSTIDKETDHSVPKVLENIPEVTDDASDVVNTDASKTDVVYKDRLFISESCGGSNDTNNDHVKESIKTDKTYSEVVKSEPYKDKFEKITHEQEVGDEIIKTETKLVRNSVEISESDKRDVQVEVTVKTESVKDAAKVHSDLEFVNIDDIVRKDDKAMKKIEAITEDLGNLIQEMKDMSSKSKDLSSHKVDISVDTNIVPVNFNRDIVLKKNKSESSLDSPDLEVSRLMNKKVSPFRDSSSSLEISGSSMESLNALEKSIVTQDSVKNIELDRRKPENILSTESSVESTSDVTPVNSGNFLNMSMSSNESVSPIIFGKSKKIHGSLSSLEASVSSLESKLDKIMVTSADSGIEHSLQNPSDNNDASSNEGTLTHNSSLKETVKRNEGLQETITSSPKRTSSLLDVPALKSKGLDRMRKISWVAPSPSFHIPRVEEKVREEKPSHLEKLLSLFQHPTSLFSRSQSDDERKSASNTPPRKDSSLTSSFWSWGSALEKEKEEKEDSSEATDSTLSERVQVSFVDESFSKKLDSKTPSTDTDNTLSEFQTISQNPESEKDEGVSPREIDSVTDNTTDELVQKCLDLSLNAGSEIKTRASDTIDLSKPNDLNDTEAQNALDIENEKKVEETMELARPRSFAAVLKASGSENSLEKQPSPDAGQLVNKLPVKVIRGIKENISPENTLTSSITNTQALAVEMTHKHQPIVNALWELSVPVLDKTDPKTEDAKVDLAPIATIDETCDISADNNIQLAFIDDVKAIDERSNDESTDDSKVILKGLEKVDLGKDALSYLIYESQDFEPDTEHAVAMKVEEGSLAQELKDAAIKEMIDLSPELVIDEGIEVFPAKEVNIGSSPVIPDRTKIKSNSLEDLSQRQEKEEKSPKTKTIAFKVPETSPRDIPERRSKLRSRSGSSPKSLPESLNKPCPLSKMDSITSKKKKRVSSLGKIARDSLLALNMSEEEIAEFRRSYKLTSVESLRSLESVSEDANSQSGTSVDSRCRACLRTSQESLMSLDSITEDCRCMDEEKHGRSRCLDDQKPRSAR